MKYTLMMAFLVFAACPVPPDVTDNAGTTSTTTYETATTHNALMSMPKRDVGVDPGVYEVPTFKREQDVVDGGYVADGGYVDDNDPMVGGCSSTTGNGTLVAFALMAMAGILMGIPARRGSRRFP